MPQRPKPTPPDPGQPPDPPNGQRPESRRPTDWRTPRHHHRPWEPLEGEGAEAFAAAQCYFELGPDRSLTIVAQKCHKSRSLIARWSDQFHWVERARLYDLRRARIEQRAREQVWARQAEDWEVRRNRLRERDWELAERLYQLAERYLDDEEKYDRTEPRLSDVTALLRRASELARLAAGLPTRPTAARPPLERDPSNIDHRLI